MACNGSHPRLRLDRAKTQQFRERLSAGGSVDDVLEEAFAVVREAAWRVLELRHYDVQVILVFCYCCERIPILAILACTGSRSIHFFLVAGQRKTPQSSPEDLKSVNIRACTTRCAHILPIDKGRQAC